MSEHDPFFRHYFRRIDPEVAASFTAEQRRAIKLMFAMRSAPHHAIDMRKSVGIFGRRFYFVLLGGVEKRHVQRLHREGMASHTLDVLATIVAAMVLLVPVGGVFYLANAALGVELVAEDTFNGFFERVGAHLAAVFH